MDKRSNDTDTRSYPRTIIHRTRDTYVLMATISVLVLALAFSIVFMHRRCKKSFKTFKKWISAKSSADRRGSDEDIGTPRRTTSGSRSRNRNNIGLLDPSSPVHSKDVSPACYMCKEDQYLKFIQVNTKDNKTGKENIKTMNTIQEDAGEEDSGISMISTSPLPKHYAGYDPSMLTSANFKNTPITVKHEGCQNRVLAPESFPDSKADQYHSELYYQEKSTYPGDLIPSRHSSIASFIHGSLASEDFPKRDSVASDDFMRRNSSFSSLDGFGQLGYGCKYWPKLSVNDDLSIGTSKGTSDAGSRTNISQTSGEYCLHERHSSFESLTSNEILLAIDGALRRSSLKPKLESKGSFDSLSTETVLEVCDRDSCIDIMERHLAADDTTDSSDNGRKYVDSKDRRKIYHKKSKAKCKNGYNNAAFEYPDEGGQMRRRCDNQTAGRCASERYEFQTNAQGFNTKTKVHRVSRSKSFPNRRRDSSDSITKLVELPSIMV